ncbi:MAG: hypothetical protein NTY19_50240 [Planctomycetota bacterium]|nr:hypothetical protein [Planctomycetota bacterium]
MSPDSEQLPNPAGQEDQELLEAPQVLEIDQRPDIPLGVVWM